MTSYRRVTSAGKEDHLIERATLTGSPPASWPDARTIMIIIINGNVVEEAAKQRDVV